MKVDVFDWVDENLYALAESDDDECKYIYGLHLLLVETECEGFRGYLTSFSADTFSYVHHAFDALAYAKGQMWVRAVENAFGGAVPAGRDDRIGQVRPVPPSKEAKSLFSTLSDELDELIPEIESMLERLVEKKKSESSWRPDPNKRLGGHL